MTSKFQEKLKRLHDSRVKALNQESRSIEADPIESTPDLANSPIEPTIPRSPRFDGLKRAKELEAKTKSSRTPIKTNDTAEQRAKPDDRIVGASGSIGERVKALRLQVAQAEENPIALLYEMVALQPDNTFALSRLVQYHRERGEHEFAQLFAERLKSHSPF